MGLPETEQAASAPAGGYRYRPYTWSSLPPLLVSLVLLAVPTTAAPSEPVVTGQPSPVTGATTEEHSNKSAALAPVTALTKAQTAQQKTLGMSPTLPLSPAVAEPI